MKKTRKIGESRLKKIAGHYREILELTGFDTSSGDMTETPIRAARAFVDMTEGYRTDTSGITKIFKRECRRAECSNLIILQGIQYVSLCEHHLLPFSGTITIGYIPSENILGLSKLTRIARLFAKRLQNQERMAHDIAEFINTLLKPQGVAVVIDGKQMCSAARGIEDGNSCFKVDVVQGLFLDNPMTRAEFFSRISTKQGG